MATHRSINQRLNRAKKIESKKAAANEWIDDWYKDQLAEIKKLERAISLNDYDALCRATGSLKQITLKRFAALPNVIDHFVNLIDGD